MTDEPAGATPADTAPVDEAPEPSPPAPGAGAGSEDGGTPVPYKPTLFDTLMLEVPFDVQVSPDGEWAAVTSRTTNWKDNLYDDVCYAIHTSTRWHYRMNHQGSAYQVEWLDSHNLALLKGTPGDHKAQVWLYEGLIGEGWPVTDHKTGVDWFSPFAGGLIFQARHPDRDEKKPRADRFGDYLHVEQEESAAALYYTGIKEMRGYRARVKASTEDDADKLVRPVLEISRLLPEPLSIQLVVPSPAGDALYLLCQERDDLVYTRDTSSFRITLDPEAALAEHLRRESEESDGEEGGTAAAPALDGAGPAGEEPAAEDLSWLGEITPLHLPRGAYITAVSPGGRRLLVTHRGGGEEMFRIQDLWLLDVEAALNAPDVETTRAAMRNLTAELDRWVMDCYWVEDGIFVSYPDGTRIRVARLDTDGTATPLDFDGLSPLDGLHVSAGGHIGFVGTSAGTFPEPCLAQRSEDGPGWSVSCLSRFGRAVESWDLPAVETIRWQSRDGTEIEGVLLKPAGFDPNKRYPLVLVVHGGPTWFSPAYLINGEDRRYYPSIQFVNKGMLVLKPNYRGSMGRGQAFLELNVDNLGVGDQWDIESAVDHLVELGWVDPGKVGCMGWSQGGYISAFVGLHSDKFAAVSVGAGISDWYTYHISNDIPHFTTDYLSVSPFRDRAGYSRTAPISALASARTPVLIQHGSDDRRVPFSNAMELYRGLKEMGVPVELFMFPGMGHPITRPRENHAVMHQNLAWFSHYLLGEPLELE